MFEELGFFKEYYVNNKFMGTIIADKDRDIIGYNGRTKEVLKEMVQLDNKKKIKANIEVMTMLYPLCGKLIK